jgi:HAD superfamily phosphoserine phosphatase-like hydrolase
MAERQPSTTISAADHFVSSVLDLHPRLAVFDCDGTLWSGDGGKDFLYWEAQAGLLPEAVKEWALPRYASYMRGEVDEETMCGEMVTLHAGLKVPDIEAAADLFIRSVIEQRVFPEMQKLVRSLIHDGCDIWAVSSTNNWVIEAGVRRFGIPKERVIAASVVCENGIATGRLVRVPTDEGKAKAIREVIQRVPDAVFGNSFHDAAMLQMAKHAFAINPNPDLKELADERSWNAYQPTLP